jgi:hypothetical protein
MNFKMNVLKSFLQLSFVIFTGILVACVPQFKEPEYQTNATNKFQIPWYSEGRGYELEWIDIHSYKSVKPVSSNVVNFYLTPGIKKGQITGEVPSLNLLNIQKRKWVPKDSLTAELLSITAHFEAFKKYDEQLGIEGLTPWPFDVGVSVHYLENNGRYAQNNAMYDGDIRALLVVPYSLQYLPLSINGSVLAHEHFHAIFHGIILKTTNALALESESQKEKNQLKKEALHKIDYNPHLKDKIYEQFLFKVDDPETQSVGATIKHRKIETNNSRDLYYSIMLRAVNEGYADFWGWSYKGDSEFVSRSILVDESRNVQASLETFWTTEKIQELVEKYSSKNILIGKSYELGSQFAKNLRVLTQSYAESHHLEIHLARKLVAKAVIKGVEKLSFKIKEMNEDDGQNPPKENPSSFFQLVFESLPDKTPKDDLLYTQMSLAEKLYQERLLKEKSDKDLLLKETPKEEPVKVNEKNKVKEVRKEKEKNSSEGRINEK